MRHSTSLIILLCVSLSAQAEENHLEFFELKIRPLLSARCYACHSANSEELAAGLYLDRRQGILEGGDSGAAVVPGSPDESLLIRAIKYEDNEMPPDGKLSDQEIALLEEWVSLGAPWPEEESPELVDANGDYDWQRMRSEHWSFRPLRRPQRPTVNDPSWVQEELDYFVRARHEAAGLTAAERAPAAILVRRIYLDLIGIPPTPQQVQEFVRAAKHSDASAVESLVDELLMSPHYGERWGRHWLDVARYSDGYGGFLDNRPKHQAWRYRDWVVAALNRDLAYDEFIRLQVAGDLIGSRDDAIATGFFALGPTYQSDGGDPESVAQANSETLDDRMDTLSRGLLGLTVSCARCHDHKFDPIPQEDYYSIAGIFHSSGVGESPLVEEAVVEAYHKHQDEMKRVEKTIKDKRNQAKKEKRELTDDEAVELEQRQQRLTELKETAPQKYPTAHTLHDRSSENMRIALRGNPRKPGAVAPRRFLKIVAGDERANFADGSGRRELSDAITSPTNPLTARVLVNRIWMHHFGEALVRSPSNFGTLGEAPTHPRLLDYLAVQLIESGWSIKSLHRRIMNSATYQMSSGYDEENFSIDGDNRFIWRMNPRRMDVESWRDSLLWVTGELDMTIGGPPHDDLAATNRRTLYAKVSRNGDAFASDSFLRLFDFPLMRATVAKRPVSVVPQQFLFMMNSQFMVDRAHALAKRLEQAHPDVSDQIRSAHWLLFGREASVEELRLAQEFLANPESTELPRLVQYAQVLLCSNEFMFVR